MDKLSLEHFLSAGTDPESARYRILAFLKKYVDEFDHNRLYPVLSDLIALKQSLEAIIEGRSKLASQLPQDVKGIDLASQKLILQAPDLSCSPLDHVVELIRWALPLLAETIEEGMKIYDIVETNLAIKEVGIIPVYHDEGYWLVPDNKASVLHLIQFSLALYESETEKFRTLKTRILRSVFQSSIEKPAESIKMDLIQEHHDLPNPATFVCETDLDFPFAETIFPVAKRKLMARLAA